MIKILLVGGTWTPRGEKWKMSGFVEKIYQALLKNYNYEIVLHNGGVYDSLSHILESSKDCDIVFWWPYIEDNSLPKIRNVKEFAPKTMLVTSKRNDDNKYTFMELIQHTLAAKANLTFEFKKTDNGLYHIMVFDPLGCKWYNGMNIEDAINQAMDRLLFLKSMTRQNTIQAHTDKGLVLSWFFDQFKQPEYQSNKQIDIPNEEEFVLLVREYAEQFQQIMKPANNTKRFLGNASLKPQPPQVGRCLKGMPSFKMGDYVFVSQRNVDKQFLDLNHFVPAYMEDDKLYYCGNEKPSVDTPIQIRLYKLLPNIHYMIHSHCYIKGAPFTEMSIPCGAIEEVEEVQKAIDKYYGSTALTSYKLNLKGHGSIVMGASLEDLKNIEYIGRRLPENMYEEKK